MFEYICFRCLKILSFAEGLRCSNCDTHESAAGMAANSYSAIPENGNGNPEFYVPAEHESTQVSEEDIRPTVPTREESTQTFEENTCVPLPIAVPYAYGNSSKSDSPTQNKASHALDEYKNAKKITFPSNSSTNEGEFRDQSPDICNAAASQEVIDVTPAAAQETYHCGQSSDGGGESKNKSDQLLTRQGKQEPTEDALNADNFVFTGLITFYTEYPVVKLLDDSSDNVEVTQDKGNIPPPYSSLPRRNPSVSNCLQINLKTAKALARQKPQTCSKLWKRMCKKCRRHFLKESTVYAHLQGHCIQKTPYKCRQCDKEFPHIGELSRHQRVHTGAKPFKCNQCDFASAWEHCFDAHLKMYTNTPSPLSSFSRRSPSVNKYFQEPLVTAKTVAQNNPQTLNKKEKSKRNRCKKCGKYFIEHETFIAQVQSNYDLKLFKCDKCDEKFSCMSKLSTHQRVHTGEKPLKCNQCDYASASQDCLDKHLKMHTNISTSLSSFSSGNSSVNKCLQESLLIAKTIAQQNPQNSNNKGKGKRHHCKKCRKYFMKEETLLAHVQSNCHLRPFKCDKCDERFSAKSILSMHQRVHTREKQFKCTLCDYASVWRLNLKIHLETHH